MNRESFTKFVSLCFGGGLFYDGGLFNIFCPSWSKPHQAAFIRIICRSISFFLSCIVVLALSNSNTVTTIIVRSKRCLFDLGIVPIYAEIFLQLFNQSNMEVALN